MNKPKTQLQQRAEQALAFVRGMKKPDGTPLFAGVGFPILSGECPLPYALLADMRYYTYFNMIMHYNQHTIDKTIDMLLNTPGISRVRGPRYERDQHHIYVRIPFTIKLPDQER